MSYDSPSTRLSLESVAVGCVDGDHDDHGDCDDYPDVINGEVIKLMIVTAVAQEEEQGWKRH